MNWSQVKAMNSTVGTKEFKPLDRILEDKFNSLRGLMRPAIGFESLTADYNTTASNSHSLNVSTVSNQFYVVEGELFGRTEDMSISQSYRFRTNPFSLDGGLHHHAESILFDSKANSESLVNGQFYQIIIDFFDSSQGYLNFRFAPFSMAGTLVAGWQVLKLKIDNVYEVI